MRLATTSTTMTENTWSARPASTNSIAAATPTTVRKLVTNVTAPSSTNSDTDSTSDVIRLTSTPVLERSKNGMSRWTRCRKTRERSSRR